MIKLDPAFIPFGEILCADLSRAFKLSMLVIGRGETCFDSVQNVMIEAPACLQVDARLFQINVSCLMRFFFVGVIIVILFALFLMAMAVLDGGQPAGSAKLL